MTERKSLIQYSLNGKEAMTEIIVLNRVPEENEWLWSYGTELHIYSKEKTYFLIYIDNTELGLLFYDKNKGTILYYDELINEISKLELKEINVLIPSPKKLIQNYLKGITVNTVLLTNEVSLNEKQLKYYKNLLIFLSSLEKEL